MLINAQEFMEAAKKLQKCATGRNSKTALQCVNVEMADAQVSLTTTDGHRICTLTLADKGASGKVTYPNIENVIPKEFPFGFSESRLKLAALLKSMASLKDTYVSLHPAYVKSENVQVERKVQAQHGDSLSVNFNVKYLLEILNGLTPPMTLCEDNVTFEFSGQHTAARITSESCPGLTYILMPLGQPDKRK